MHCFQCPLITNTSFVLLITKMIILLNFNSNTKLDNGVTCKANLKQNEIRRNETKQKKIDKRKQKQTKSRSYNKWTYQYYGSA